MVKVLDVYFHEKKVGQLTQDKSGDINFVYSTEWLESPVAARISCSLPLQQEPFNRKTCHAYFGGILPEENQRRIIARNLGISVNNDFSMLEKIGGECAGALSFLPEGERFNTKKISYHELVGTALPSILRELPSRPLLAGEDGVRLSLAGVQDKLAVYCEDGKISIPLNNAPSTHILKPNFSHYDGVIFNEAFCLKLAKKIGLSVADVEIKQAEDISFLLIKRYDRIVIASEINRVHQEDFCQALSIPSSNKYQNEGGPSFKQCFDLIRKESLVPVIDLEKLLNAVIFNYLIGNCDAHGKNFSLLYLTQFQLAPLYDLICTVYYEDLDKRMAMKLGGEYSINNISLENFNRLADEIGFAKPLVRKRILESIEAIVTSLPSIEIEHKVQEDVASIIKTRCESIAKNSF